MDGCSGRDTTVVSQLTPLKRLPLPHLIASPTVAMRRWAIIYAAQVNPLVAPEYKSVSWEGLEEHPGEAMKQGPEGERAQACELLHPAMWTVLSLAQ